ncbi:hypothetical protein JXB02_01830 [Candidatus Woesearchaeota archaeon]|nr:hypothetical protein [Candidatus Woesearchaeota archaeon]
MVVVLGINDGHNAGAALVRDGAVVAAVQEERLNNTKNYSGVPKRAIHEVYRIAKVHPHDTDVIAMVSLNRTYAPLKEMPFRVKAFLRLSPFIHSHAFVRWYVAFLHRFRPMREVHDELQRLGILDKELVFVDHQSCHAACAHHSMPARKKNLVLTSDGAGDGLSSTVSVGDGSDIRRIASSTYYDSLGNVLYSEVTGYLGLKRWEHEYKVMGMAPYGKAEHCIEKMRKVIRINPRRPLEFQNTIGAVDQYVERKFMRLFLGERFDNLSAACQQHFEDLMEQWVRNAIRKTGIHDVVGAGGLFLNVKANKVIREMEEVDSTFFYPAADDGGTPVGAALKAYNDHCRRRGIKPRQVEIGPVYYGQEYDNDAVKETLKRTGWLKKAQYIDDIDGHVGDLLAKGHIVARCTGRVEWGPRALGNRSILADARDLKKIRDINFAIKKRDFWMPFAVSILDERKGRYLVGPKKSPYMIEAFDTTDARDEILAGTHPFDLTARPQTVEKAWSPGYHRILTAFEDQTGVGGLLNTSFNLHGSPLVGSPEVALKTMQDSGLTLLAMGNWLVTKK